MKVRQIMRKHKLRMHQQSHQELIMSLNLTLWKPNMSFSQDDQGEEGYDDDSVENNDISMNEDDYWSEGRRIKGVVNWWRCLLNKEDVNWRRWLIRNFSFWWSRLNYGWLYLFHVMLHFILDNCTNVELWCFYFGWLYCELCTTQLELVRTADVM